MKNKHNKLNKQELNKQLPPAMRFFMSINDPRIDRHKAHPLTNILMIAICSVLSGAETFVDMEDFGNAKKDWLSSFLDLSGGIPSHDTFGRVFSLLNPREFQESFVSWIRSCVELSEGQVIAVDGKSNRRTFGRLTKALHVVSAYATANGVSLGQVATDQKSNEITAIPELLKILDIAGCLITTDAMGCQSDIAAEVVDGGGDYLLAVKGNQGLLYRDIKACFAEYPDDPVLKKAYSSNTTEDSGHGRIEKRVCELLSGAQVIERVRHKNNWIELSTVVRVTAIRTDKKTGETSKAIRYYICSLEHPRARRIQQAVRQHWGVENGLHWSLDMALNEDQSRARTDHAPANMSLLRHIVLNVVRMDETRKVGIKASLKKAGWDTKYLERLLKLAVSGV